MTDHPDAARMRDVVAPLKAALDTFNQTPTPYAEESWDAAIPVLEEAEKLVKLINDQADELNARWRLASLPMNPQVAYDAVRGRILKHQVSDPLPAPQDVYNAVMEHAAIARGDLPSCVGCARLSTEHRPGCPNG